MSLKLYDTALVQKVQAWTKDCDLRIYNPAETKRLFEVISQQNNDSAVELPLLCIRRPSGFNISNPNKKPITYDGFTLDAERKSSFQLNAIPIQVNYQLDIYTRFQEEADEYCRNLIFNFVNFPKLEVDLPYYDYQYKHESTVYISPEVEDNSNIPERLISGEFTRLTIQLYVDNAYLWDIRKRENYQISVKDIEMK